MDDQTDISELESEIAKLKAERYELITQAMSKQALSGSFEPNAEAATVIKKASKIDERMRELQNRLP